jgi:hypothetical protein
MNCSVLSCLHTGLSNVGVTEGGRAEDCEDGGR